MTKPFTSLFYQTIIQFRVDLDESGQVIDTVTTRRFTTAVGEEKTKKKEKPKPATKKLQTQLQDAAEL